MKWVIWKYSIRYKWRWCTCNISFYGNAQAIFLFFFLLLALPNSLDIFWLNTEAQHYGKILRAAWMSSRSKHQKLCMNQESKNRKHPPTHALSHTHTHTLFMHEQRGHTRNLQGKESERLGEPRIPLQWGTDRIECSWLQTTPQWRQMNGWVSRRVSRGPRF